MIEFDNVSFAYEKDNPVLKNISLVIQEGESVGVVGANGAGKSTLMKILAGLIEADGIVSVNGIRMSKNTISSIRQMCGFVLQNSDDQMFMPTVYEDMIFGPLNYKEDREIIDKRVDETLRDLDIEYLKHRYNHRMSGGEKRMAAIATVLAMKPEIIIMDEPTAALDPYNRRQVINVINTLTQTKLIISHDLDMIYETCERVILLGNGEIAADGNREDILKNKKLLEDNRLELPLQFQRNVI